MCAPYTRKVLHFKFDRALTFAQIGTIVGTFIAGYGLMHIPGGLISELIGMRYAILLGIAVETAGTVVTAHAETYAFVLAGRFVCGAGASVYFGSVIGLTTAWFREHELATANGLIVGVAFTVGAILGLFVWPDLVVGYGWRTALMAGALVGAATFVSLIFVFPIPPRGGEYSEIDGAQLNVQSLKRTFGNAQLWIAGLCFVGGYGAYFTTAQLLPSYAANHLSLTRHVADSLGVTLLIGGSIGAIFAGWISDRFLGPLLTVLAGIAVESLALICVPHVGLQGLQVAAVIIGAAPMASFISLIAIPGYSRSVHTADIPTACGLMLTIVAVGGVTVPVLYGAIADAYGFSYAWTSLGLISIVTAFAGLFLRRSSDSGFENAATSDALD
jgi:ACS family D-galactonate transporter-like MFS transporter